MISKELEDILRYSSQEAARTGSYEVTPDHLMLGILRHDSCKACLILDRMGVDRKDFKEYLDCVLGTGKTVPENMLYRILPSRGALNAMSLAIMDARFSGNTQAGSDHLLASLSHCPGAACATYLEAKGAGRRRIMELLPGKAPEAPRKDLAADIADALEAEIRRTLSKGDSIPS